MRVDPARSAGPRSCRGGARTPVVVTFVVVALMTLFVVGFGLPDWASSVALSLLGGVVGAGAGLNQDRLRGSR